MRRDGERGAGVRMKTKLVSGGVYQRIISALRGAKAGASVRIVITYFARIIIIITAICITGAPEDFEISQFTMVN